MGSFSELGSIFARMAVSIPEAGHRALDKASEAVLNEARAIPGNYQEGWASLKPETIARKATGDSPLLETGALRDSYSRAVEHDHALVGTNDPRAAWLQLGTTKIPPRPVLTTAVNHKREEIENTFKAELKSVLKLRR